MEKGGDMTTKAGNLDVTDEKKTVESNKEQKSPRKSEKNQYYSDYSDYSDYSEEEDEKGAELRTKNTANHNKSPQKKKGKKQIDDDIPKQTTEGIHVIDSLETSSKCKDNDKQETINQNQSVENHPLNEIENHCIPQTTNDNSDKNIQQASSVINEQSNQPISNQIIEQSNQQILNDSNNQSIPQTASIINEQSSPQTLDENKNHIEPSKFQEEKEEGKNHVKEEKQYSSSYSYGEEESEGEEEDKIENPKNVIEVSKIVHEPEKNKSEKVIHDTSEIKTNDVKQPKIGNQSNQNESNILQKAIDQRLENIKTENMVYPISNSIYNPETLQDPNEDLPPQPPSRGSSSRRHRSIPSRVSQVSNYSVHEPPKCSPRVQQLKEMASKGKSLSKLTNDQFNELLFFLEIDRNLFSSKKKFNEGAKIQKTIDYVNNCQTKALKKQLQDEEMKRVGAEIKYISNEIAEFDSKTAELKASIVKKQEEHLEALKAFHDNELNDLHETWSSPAKVRMYNRPTNRLLSMQRQLSFLIEQKRFEEASYMQSQINTLQREEERASYENMQRVFDEMIRKKVEKNRIEIQVYKDKCKMEISQFMSHRNIEKKPLTFKLQKAKIKEGNSTNEEKLWNRKGGVLTESILERGMKPSARSFKAPSSPFNHNTVLLNLPPLVLHVQPKDLMRNRSRPKPSVEKNDS